MKSDRMDDGMYESLFCCCKNMMLEAEWKSEGITGFRIVDSSLLRVVCPKFS